MTQMKEKEILINFILAVLTTTLGASLWIFCEIGFRKGFLLPEYALAWKGVGQALLALGLIWISLSALKKLLAS